MTSSCSTSLTTSNKAIMKNFFVQATTYLLTPFLLYMDYSTQDGAWLFIYGTVCAIALIAYIMSILGVIIMTYDAKSITDDTKKFLNDSYTLLKNRKYISYAYGIAPFIYLTFTHHYILAGFSLICSVIAWILIAIILYEYKQLQPLPVASKLPTDPT